MRIAKFFFVALAASALASMAYGQGDWPTYGRDLAGTRYSPLKQIDTKNVTKLVRAWTYHMTGGAPAAQTAPAPGSSEAGDAVAGRGRGRGGRGGRGGGGNSEVSPLIINGVMYLTTGGGKVAALE